MGSNRNTPTPASKTEVSDILSHVVNFGSESALDQRKDAEARLKRIVRKLQDISRRLDHLASHS